MTSRDEGLLSVWSRRALTVPVYLLLAALAFVTVPLWATAGLALDTLAAAPISTPAIRNELELGRGQWLFFESALQRKPDDKALETVATTSERLLEVLERLTDLYDVALKEVLG